MIFLILKTFTSLSYYIIYSYLTIGDYFYSYISTFNIKKLLVIPITFFL